MPPLFFGIYLYYNGWELLRNSQLGAVRAMIFRKLLSGRKDGLAIDKPQLCLVTAHTNGKIPRASAARRKVGKFLLDGF